MKKKKKKKKKKMVREAVISDLWQKQPKNALPLI